MRVSGQYLEFEASSAPIHAPRRWRFIDADPSSDRDHFAISDNICLLIYSSSSVTVSSLGSSLSFFWSFGSFVSISSSIYPGDPWRLDCIASRKTPGKSLHFKRSCRETRRWGGTVISRSCTVFQVVNLRLIRLIEDTEGSRLLLTSCSSTWKRWRDSPRVTLAGRKIGYKLWDGITVRSS